jgi:large subunit ribosomal protein L29
MRPSEMREMTVEELRGTELDLRKELFNLRFQGATGEIQNPMRIRQVKREISRVLTVIGEMTRPEAAKEDGN